MAAAEGEDRLKRPSPHPPPYGTFLPTFTPPPPSAAQPQLFYPPTYHQHHPFHQPVSPGYHYVTVVEGVPVRERRLPCCGVGIGWILFLAGFFFAAVPWYVGALILLCVGIDRREKPGLVACTIGATLASFVVFFGLSSNIFDW